jgi:hypothetical protein
VSVEADSEDEARELVWDAEFPADAEPIGDTFQIEELTDVQS